jgi:hypothetical protein
MINSLNKERRRREYSSEANMERKDTRFILRGTPRKRLERYTLWSKRKFQKCSLHYTLLIDNLINPLKPSGNYICIPDIQTICSAVLCIYEFLWLFLQTVINFLNSVIHLIFVMVKRCVLF